MHDPVQLPENLYKKKTQKIAKKKELSIGRTKIESIPNSGHGKREGTCERVWPPWMWASELRSSSPLFFGEGSRRWTTGARSSWPEDGLLNDFGLGPISTEVAQKPICVDYSDNRFEQVHSSPFNSIP